jgi:hypothetical protein
MKFPSRFGSEVLFRAAVISYTIRPGRLVAEMIPSTRGRDK